MAWLHSVEASAVSSATRSLAGPRLRAALVLSVGVYVSVIV